MSKAKLFSEDEIPYETLSDFGLTREMIEDLPMSVLDDISSGSVTPVLPIRVKVDDERSVQAKSRFSLNRLSSGVNLLFYPVLEHAPLEQFDEQQQALLKEGKTILAEINKDGEKVTSFVQVDTATNQVMSVPSPVIGRNLQVIADEVSLSGPELNVIQNGDPLTIVVDDAEVTIGIDLLNSKTGVRIEDGDIQKWRNSFKRDWDKYTFGVYGCWMTDENGDLSYVPEDEYTEEIWNELKVRSNMQHR